MTLKIGWLHEAEQSLGTWLHDADDWQITYATIPASLPDSRRWGPERLPGMHLGNFPRRALLTGAGFTKNWGGHLAGEIWTLLASTEVARSNSEVRRILYENVGAFEAALEQARRERAQAEHLEREVGAVFVAQEESLDVQLARQSKLEEMLCWFGRGPRNRGSESEGIDTGYIFTLNQDRFVESVCKNDHQYYQSIATPGMPRRQPASPGDPDQLHEVHTVSNSIDGIRLAGNVNYIKLHGAYNWRSADGKELLVVGGGKQATLEAFPLLAWYLETFRSVCHSGDLRLMVIGYGFGDEHINRVLADGIREAGLRLFLVDPTVPRNTLTKLRNSLAGETLVDAIDGWSTSPLSTTFRDATRSPEYRRILQEFFGVQAGA